MFGKELDGENTRWLGKHQKSSWKLVITRKVNHLALPCCVAPTQIGVCSVALGSSLPIRELQYLGSLLRCHNRGLWRNLNSTRPFHSFGSPGRAFVTVKKFLSPTVAVDPSLYIL